MNFKSLALAVILALAASAAQSVEPVYKSTMPDGRVMYGEIPQPGARRVDKVAAPPESAGIVVATPQDKTRAGQIQLPPRATVTVIPQPDRPSPQPAQQGSRGNAADALPTRGY